MRAERDAALGQGQTQHREHAQAVAAQQQQLHKSQVLSIAP